MEHACKLIGILLNHISGIYKHYTFYYDANYLSILLLNTFREVMGLVEFICNMLWITYVKLVYTQQVNVRYYAPVVYVLCLSDI